MRRASKIALLAVGGSVLILFSATASFLVGHGVGAGERRAVTKSAFQAWSLVCREGRCALFIAVADPNTRQVLLTFSVARTAKGITALIVDTPAGVTIGEGVTVTAGAAEAITLPIQSCAQRCRAVTELTPPLRAALETAAVTAVTYVRADTRPATYNLPTGGFKDGMVAWSAGG